MHTFLDTCKVVKALVIGESGRGGRTAFDRDRVTAAIAAGSLIVRMVVLSQMVVLPGASCRFQQMVFTQSESFAVVMLH